MIDRGNGINFPGLWVMNDVVVFLLDSVEGSRQCAIKNVTDIEDKGDT